MSKTKKLIAIVLALTMLFGIIIIAPFTVSAESVYAITYLVGIYDMFPETDGNISATINGSKYYYSDDYGEYDDISDNFSSMENQNVLYELHNSKIARVYSMDNVLVPKITVEPDVKEGLTYRNGKFSQSSFDLAVKVSVQPKSVFQENSISWFLSDDEQKESLYLTLKNLEIEPSGGVDFGSSGWWLWKDYQTKISENVNDKIKMGETKEYHYTVNLQDGKALNQKEYNIELYTTPTFDFGTVDRTTSKIKVGNLDYQAERTEEKKATSTSGKTVTQASNKLAGVESALQFSNNLLTSDQTEQINEYVNLWISELILAKYVDKSDLKQKVTEDIANEWLSKLGLDTSVLLVPGTIQATTYLKTQTKDGTKIFIEFYINMMDFDFGNSGMPTMATGSGTATIYNMDGEKLDSSVILPAYADICAFCEQLQSVAKNTIFNGAKQYRIIFGKDTDATAEALSSQLMTKLLNNKYTKDIFKKVDAKDVKTALKKIISEGDKKCGNKIFELVTTPSQDSTLISVKCPVDVTVYDNDGNICGMVKNNVVDTSYSDVYINVVGDQKNIYLIGDDYTFTMSGTDSGTMDYVVTEFDESGNKTREITYSNIELTDGCKYYSYVPEAENHNSCLFDLTDSEGNVISATTGGESDTYITESSGKCGDDVYWTLYSDGTLYINGTGSMYDYSCIFDYQYDNVYYYPATPWPSDINTVIITKNVKNISDYAFLGCTNLKCVTIADSVTRIGKYAFLGCTSLASITIPDSVTRIGSCAFENCTSLESITIPDSVTSIGGEAFSGCTSLESITIPDNVTSIGGSLFDNTPYYNNESNWEDGVLYLNNYLIATKNSIPNDYEIKTGTTIIAGGAFQNRTKLKNVTIPNGVTSIGTVAFSGCSNLESITIPNSVTSIGGVIHPGNSAFSDCKNLMTVTIPGELDINSNSVFDNCKIKEVIISDGTKRVKDQGVGNNVYEYAEKISIPDSVINIDGDVFDDSVWYNNQPDGMVYAGKFAYKFKGEMPESTTVIIKDGIKGIADRAFNDCINLTNITIPDSVTSLGSSTFENCTSLTSVTIGKGVTSIGYETFFGCTSLTNVTIPDSTTAIGSYAFSSCTSLESITIPDSVTSIRYHAFEDCTSLKDVYYSGSEEDWNNIAIDYDNGSLLNATIHFSGQSSSEPNIIVDENTGISVTTNSGSVLSVEKLTDSENAADVIAVLEDNQTLIDLFDITLTKDGEVIRPDDPATVKIPCDNENAKVYRIEDNGTKTDMNAVYEDGYMVFTTDHFSLYVLVVPNDNLVSEVSVGDVNGDTILDINDVTYLQKFLAGYSDSPIDITDSAQFAVANFNGDDVVDINDVTAIQMKLAGYYN